MPIFVAGFINALAFLYTFFKKSGITRYALIAAGATAVLVAFGVVKTLLVGLVAGISVAVPSLLITALSWIAPYNIDDCISARIAAELAFAVYRWQHNIVLQSAINAQ